MQKRTQGWIHALVAFWLVVAAAILAAPDAAARHAGWRSGLAAALLVAAAIHGAWAAKLLRAPGDGAR